MKTVCQRALGWATHLLQLQEGRASLQPLGPDMDVFQLVTSEVKWGGWGPAKVVTIAVETCLNRGLTQPGPGGGLVWSFPGLGDPLCGWT